MKLVLLLTVGLVGLAACGRGTVDTTKDVYDDSEAPEYQIYVVNGEERKIPWKEVASTYGRGSSTKTKDSHLPWTVYKVRVPIVKVEIWAHDKDGNPMDPAKARCGTVAS
jgi:hypothetical protein